MNYGFIAALIIMVIMTAFTIIIIKTLVVGAGNRIRDYAVEQMQHYDTLIQKKSDELNEIREGILFEQQRGSKKAAGQSNWDQVAEVFVPPFAEYRDSELFIDYLTIKNNFVFQKQNIVEQLALLASEKYNNEANTALKHLIEKLSVDNVYKLSTLHNEEQLEIIREIATEKEGHIIDEYLSQRSGFCCIDFLQWLHMQKELRDEKIYVRTPTTYDIHDLKVDNLIVEHDKELCEGFQILRGNKLYDYGILKRELV